MLARQAQLQLIWDQHLLATGAAPSSNGSNGNSNSNGNSFSNGSGMHAALVGDGATPSSSGVAAPAKEVVTV